MSCEGCPSKGNCGKDASTCGIVSNPNNKIKNVVAVMSGKGGVGKSTMTVMLAKSLAAQGKKVGIMDADITGPSIPRLFGVQNEQCYANENNEILPIMVEGVSLMSLNFMMENESDPVIWRGAILSNVVKQFYTDVYWGELDVLFIDMPPGTGDVALTIMQSLPIRGVVMISTPQPMVSMIVAKAIHMCEKMDVEVLGLIENMAYLECPHCNEKIPFYKDNYLEELFYTTGVKVYGELPMIDLLRDINMYETYSIEQREKTLKLVDDIAGQLIKDLGQDGN
jgi:Mrp family chromosome partitioning ATPase